VSIKKIIIASALMLLTAFSVSYMSHGNDMPPIRPLSGFPKEIGKWQGRESQFDQEIYDILGVDDSFLANYYSPDEGQVQVYVGFYQSQREGDLIHSPKNCMPGAGWAISKTSLEELNLTDSKHDKIKVIKLLLEKENQQQIVLYWFQSRGRFIHSEYWEKIFLVVDSITRNRTDGSFVRLIAPVINGDQSKALEDLKTFAEEIIPVLQEYIPS
jgi:EpsI family protein